MGFSHQQNGRLREAEKSWLEARRIMIANFGEEHAGVAALTHNLGGLYQDMSMYPEAIRMLEESFKIMCSLRGARSEEAAHSLLSLGATLHEAGNAQAALDKYADAKKIFSETFGPEHPHVATCMSNTARVHISHGKPAEALELLGKAMQIYDKCGAATDEDHADNVARAKTNMGLSFKMQARLKEARKAFEEALALTRTVKGEKHPDVSEHMNNLCTVLMAPGGPERYIVLSPKPHSAVHLQALCIYLLPWKPVSTTSWSFVHLGHGIFFILYGEGGGGVNPGQTQGKDLICVFASGLARRNP